MSQPTVERLSFVEGLRGVAIGIVLLFHATVWGGLTGRPAAAAYYGHSGVDLFFVISGFCMLWPVLRNGNIGALDPLRLYLRRWLRIAPPYLVAVAVAVAVSAAMWQYGGPTWWSRPMQSTFPASAGHLCGNLASHATFTHGLFPSYDRSIDGAFWSLSTEWQFYVLLPLLIFTARRYGVVLMVGLMSAVSLLYVVVVHLHNPSFIVSSPVTADNIVYRLVEFGAGMLAAWSVSKGRRMPLCRVIAVVGLAAAVYLDHWGPVAAAPFAYAAGFSGLILWCCWSPVLRRAADASQLRALGRVSYSAYLIHGSAYMAIAIPLTRADVAQSTRLWTLLIAGPVTAIAVSVVFHRFVERPSIKWSHAVRGAGVAPAGRIGGHPASGGTTGRVPGRPATQGRRCQAHLPRDERVPTSAGE